MEQALDKGTVLQSAKNRYTISQVLGQGSFGITYLARTQVEGPLGVIEVEVAVKEFFMKEINSREGSSVTGGSSTRDGIFEKYRQKFRREARNLSRMKHPGIVKVLEAFDTNNTSYIAMEYLGGGSLDDLIVRRGGFPEAEALRYAHAIGEALSYMHVHQMLHLDLKPSNVMLNRQGEPVIIDFGLSKQYDESGNPESSTTVGGGTPGYAPIEQARYREGEEFPVTMDVYALGATLFKMLCGHRPPDADIILNNGFPSNDFRDVSQHTIDAVAKAMACRKADRYQSVPEFLAALGTPIASVDESTTHESEETKPPHKTPPPTNPKPKKDKLLSWQWIIGLMASVVVVAVITSMKKSPEALAKEYSQKICECDKLENKGMWEEAEECYSELSDFLDTKLDGFTQEDSIAFAHVFGNYKCEGDASK